MNLISNTAASSKEKKGRNEMFRVKQIENKKKIPRKLATHQTETF